MVNIMSLKLSKLISKFRHVQFPKFSSSVSSIENKLEYTKDRYRTIRGPFTTLNKEHIQFFKNILGPGRVLTADETDLDVYNVDFFLQFKGAGKVVLKPKTTQEVSKILEFCNSNLLAVCSQGGNTGLSGAANPVFDEIILSAELMNKLISVDSVSGIMVCEAGCVLQNISNELEHHNLTVPLDLGSKGTCQIGGNVSTNAGGYRFARFGSLHGNILGLEVVKANGHVLDCLKSLRKDNTGYHLKNMFIGAEGTLGFITKVAMQCMTAPKSTNVALLGIKTYDKVLETYRHAKNELGEILSAAEFLDSDGAQMAVQNFNVYPPIGSYPFYLLIETYGSNVTHDSEKVNSFLQSSLEKGFVIDGTCSSEVSKYQGIWKFRESVALAGIANYHTFRYDFTLPLRDYYSIVSIMKKHMGDRAVAVYGFGHLGDGNIHLNILVPKYTEELHKYLEPYVFEKILELNGSISAEHGLGFKNAKYLGLSRSKEYVDTMTDIKTKMDPNGILNPYKVIHSVF